MIRRAGVLLSALAAVAAIVSGCAAPSSGDDGPIRTASDQTDAERRARVRLELASAYFSRGQTTTALDEVKLALAAKPDMPEALGLRGLIYAALGENKLADESLERALSLAPRDADMLHNHGWLLCQQGRYADADRRFDAALAQPRYRGAARTWLAKGVCDAREGRWEDAEAALLRSFEIDSANPATAYNLADVLYRRGDYPRARFYVARVNASDELSNAQSLWLATRIERRLGNASGVRDLGRQLRERFPQSSEAVQYEQGRFDG